MSPSRWYVKAIRNSIRYDEMVEEKLWSIFSILALRPSIEQLIFGVDYDKGTRSEGLVRMHSANGKERRMFSNPVIKNKADAFEREFWNLLNLAFQKNELKTYDPPLLMRGNPQEGESFQKVKWVIPFEFFQWMKEKGYPVNDTLIGFFNNNPLDYSNLKLAANQLKIFRKNMLFRMVRGENPKGFSFSSTRKISSKSSGTARKKGRRSHINWAAVQEMAKKIRAEKGLSAPKIARRSEITKILAPQASHGNLNDISDEDYKKRYGVSIRTVINHIQKSLKDS